MQRLITATLSSLIFLMIAGTQSAAIANEKQHGLKKSQAAHKKDPLYVMWMSLMVHNRAAKQIETAEHSKDGEGCNRLVAPLTLLSAFAQVDPLLDEQTRNSMLVDLDAAPAGACTPDHIALLMRKLEFAHTDGWLKFDRAWWSSTDAHPLPRLPIHRFTPESLREKTHFWIKGNTANLLPGNDNYGEMHLDKGTKTWIAKSPDSNWDDRHHQWVEHTNWTASMSKYYSLPAWENFGSPETAEAYITAAVHGKLNWQTPFLPAQTQAGTFYRSFPWKAFDPVPVQMMHLDGDFNYFSDNKMSAVILPCGGSKEAREFRVIIVKPRTGGTTIADVAAEMCKGPWFPWRELYTQRLAIAIPRFQLNDCSAPELNAAIYNLEPSNGKFGLDGAFEEAAVKLSENGIELAGAAGFSLISRRGPPPISHAGRPPANACSVDSTYTDQPGFVVDRPFMLIVEHEPTGTIVEWALIHEPIAP